MKKYWLDKIKTVGEITHQDYIDYMELMYNSNRNIFNCSLIWKLRLLKLKRKGLLVKLTKLMEQYEKSPKFDIDKDIYHYKKEFSKDGNYFESLTIDKTCE